MRLNRLEWFELATAGAFAIAVGLDAASGHPVARMAWLVLGVVLAILVIIGIGLTLDNWRVRRLRALVPLAIAVGGLALWSPAGQAGVRYRDGKFLRALPAYERVVEDFRSGILPEGDLPPESLPSELRGCCYRVIGLRDSTGHWLVEFWVGRRFPTHHDAWMYYSGPSGRAAGRARTWYSGYSVAPHWFRVAD